MVRLELRAHGIGEMPGSGRCVQSHREAPVGWGLAGTSLGRLGCERVGVYHRLSIFLLFISPFL